MLWGDKQITYTIDSRLPSDIKSAIPDALAKISAVADLEFVEVPIGGALAYVLHDEAVLAFGYGEGSDGFEVDVTDGSDLVGAYVAINPTHKADLGFLVLHETMHAMGAGPGFQDLYLTSPERSVLSYIPPQTALLGSDDVALLQESYGASPRGNLLTGRKVSDTISGGHGDDTLYGYEGSDLLYGNQGDDELFGDVGDTLYGGKDSDVLHGGEFMYGNMGDDIILSGGNSYLFGGQGDDTVYAQEGDIVHGNRGHDTVFVPSGRKVTLIGVENVVEGDYIL